MILALLLIACILIGKFLIKSDYNSIETKSMKKLCFADVFFCVAVTVAVSTFFSTFPSKNIFTATDSSVFLYIGRMMHNGSVPYKDLFDHKGIVLYFIQYIGWALTPNSYVGVFAIEMVSMFIAALYLLKTARLFTDDLRVLYLSIFAVLIVCGYPLYEGGNLTEEYALLWISMAVYVFNKYFIEHIYQKREIILLGVGFGVVLLLRVNMIAVWVSFMPAVLIYFLVHRKWKNMSECAIYFAAGVAIVIVPVLFYFIYTDSLGDMIKYYWKFNLSYTESGISLKSLYYCCTSFLKLLWIAAVAFAVSLVPCMRKREYLLNLVYTAISSALAIMSGVPYHHYAIILLPAFTIPLVHVCIFVFEWVDKCRKKVKKESAGIFNKKYMYVVLVLACIFLVVLRCQKEASDPDKVVVYLKNNTTEEDDVLILGNRAFYYLQSDRHTENKFFYQTPPININTQLYEEFLQELSDKPSDVMVVLEEKEKALGLDNNMGEVYRSLEDACQRGMLTCEVYDGFYVYRR